MTSGPLRIDRHDDGVVLLTLDVPERRNAMTEDLTSRWAEAIAALREDTGVRVVAVTGAGSAFCAGGDLGWLGAGSESSVDELRTRMLRFYRAWLSIRDLDVPTMAVINGAAVGAGLALALACDLRYAAPDAPLSVPFTALGIHAGMATTWLLPEVAGLPVARELLLTDRVVTGEVAVDLGLVNRVFPVDGLLAGALGVARVIARQAPVATRLTTGALRAGHRSIADALRWEALAQAVTMTTDDLAEGIAAQHERRRPRFTGR